MQELPGNALIVFLSDSHIGGDPGCDGFESPEELEAHFRELAALDRPVELVLAGDFFDFLQIGTVPEGENRASLTMSRGEYLDLFATLRGFRSLEGKRVVYLPGNHDAEVWWNEEIQATLREAGVVDEFAYSYLASVKVGGGRRVVYCEHGNQFDPPNTVEDYVDRLDTPLGHHVVMDFTRRVAPYGEVSPGLDLSEIKMVYPLVAIPGWVAGRYFYDFIGKVTAYLLLPLLLAYALYRVATYLLIFPGGLPRIHEIFLDIGIFGVFTVALFAVFFLVVRHAVRRTVRAMSPETGPAGRRSTPHPPRLRDRRSGRYWPGRPARPCPPPSIRPPWTSSSWATRTCPLWRRWGGREAGAAWPAPRGRQLGVLPAPVASGAAPPERPSGLRIAVRIAVRAHPRAGLRGRWRPTRGVVGAAQTRAPEPGPRRAPALLWSQAVPAPGGRRGPRAGTV